MATASSSSDVPWLQEPSTSTSNHECSHLGMHGILMKLEQTATESASKRSADEHKLAQLQALKQRVADLQQHRLKLVEACRQINSDDEHFTVNELMIMKLEQLNHAHRLIGVSVSSVGERLVRINFQTSYFGKSCDNFVTDLRLGGSVPLAIVRHNIPQFVPLSEIVAKCSSTAVEFSLNDFVWTVYSYLNAYVTRKQDALAARSSPSAAEFVGSFSSSSAHDFMELSLNCSLPVVVQLTYADLRQLLPSDVAIRVDRKSARLGVDVKHSVENLLKTRRLPKSLPLIIELLTEEVVESS